MVVHACNSSRDWEADYIVRSCVKLKKKKKKSPLVPDARVSYGHRMPLNSSTPCCWDSASETPGATAPTGADHRTGRGWLQRGWRLGQHLSHFVVDTGHTCTFYQEYRVSEVAIGYLKDGRKEQWE
jgi:hypothetical protein